MRELLLTLLFLGLWVSPLFCTETAKLEQYNVRAPPFIVINLEHAVTPRQITWGLMQRKTLPWNSGMTFNYSKIDRVNIWMFNTFLDLSVAFLDKDKVIRAIHELKSYPEMMDPKRTVRKIEDISRYPIDGPVFNFFRNRGVSSSIHTQYALEMSKNWFRDNDIESGDVVLWSVKQPTGFVLRSIDIEPFLPKNTALSLLTFPNEGPYSVWLPNGIQDRDLAFLNVNNEVVRSGTLKAGGAYSLPAKPVMYTINPAKYLLTAPAGWLNDHGVKVGSKLPL